MARQLTGKEITASLNERIAADATALKEKGIDPTLALLRIGENPDDLSYERTAIKRAESLGIATKHYVLEKTASQGEVEAAIQSINDDETVHGCLMFRPLPAHLDEQKICDLLAAEKDIDGVSLASLAAIFTDNDRGYPPCTAAACLEALDFYEIPLEGKHVVVLGRSLVVGKPVSMMLLRRNASVTMCHSRTENLPEITKSADIVICATGRPKAYGAEYFSAEQIVLDVGINFDAKGNLCGDVDFEAVKPVVGAITPVPGGLGSVTTSILMSYVVKAAGA